MALVRQQVAEWTPPARRRWAERDGRAMVAALERSGLTAGEFARRHQVDVQRVRVWRKRCGAVATPEVFVPVRVTGSVRSSPESDRGIELVLRGGMTIRVARDFDAELLRAVVATLEVDESC